MIAFTKLALAVELLVKLRSDLLWIVPCELQQRVSQTIYSLYLKSISFPRLLINKQPRLRKLSVIRVRQISRLVRLLVLSKESIHYYLLLITYYSLLITRYSLLITHYSLLINFRTNKWTKINYNDYAIIVARSFNHCRT